ncbi:MAG TPA: sialidase family protein, partial [Tepidisphaeraceae bacterium]|nr:sialidase family protein [Tepidisphaeraceae bacterium]
MILRAALVGRLTLAGIILAFITPSLRAAGGTPDTRAWVAPGASDWVSLGDRLNDAWLKAKKQAPKIGGGVLWGPLVAVDRSNGTLYAFPQGGALWVSKDRGQTFDWLNHDILAWGFNESPTNLYISPEGSKIRIFSSDHSGFSLDAGKTWKYMNFKLAFGFEDGQINWDGAGDAKMIVARSHTWPSRMWLSRDAGDSFTEFQPDIMKQVNTQSMALMEDDSLLFQSEKLMRSEDGGKTLAEVAPPPPYVTPDGKKFPATFIGLSRRFKNKVYWLNSTGVYTSGDKGKSWQIVGQNFPQEWIQQRLVRSGPLIGKDENQMLVLCLTHIGETLDGGKPWHVLARLPVRLED